MQEFTPAHIISKLRLSVLYSCEENAFFDSQVLKETGQSILEFVFPRTGLLAAVTHATKLAQAHHDEKTTKKENEFHLFRLPMHLEAAIHREFIYQIPNDYAIKDLQWSELHDLPSVSAEKSEGPVALGELDLTSPADLSRIAHSYKASLDARMLCIPYFTINR